MAYCAHIESSGAVVASSDPLEGCTGVVLVTPEEHAALVPMFPRLSIADGAMLGVAALGVWLIAWGFKQFIRAAGIFEGSTSNQE